MKEDDVDPIFFDRTYFLVPADSARAAPTVRAPARGDAPRRRRLRSEEFVRSGRGACASCARGADALALETLFLAEDVYS